MGDWRDDELLREYFDAWIDARAAAASQEPVGCGTDAELTALFEHAAHTAAALNAVWPGTGSSTAEADCPRSAADRNPPRSLNTNFADAEPQRFGRFRIERLLGRGGMGNVFLAWDPHLGRRVALKIPHPGSLIDSSIRERFLREARAGGGLKHPGIVPVFESGREQGVCYLVSEFCEGPTLAQWLSSRSGSVPPHVGAAVVAAMAGAVQHAHDRGILHRDLKPANVLLDDFSGNDGLRTPLSGDSAVAEVLPFVPRVTDFGLAQVIEEDAVLTRTGAAMGTAAYMAPEQADGDRNLIGPRSDVYALGAILYEMLTGEPPFGRGTVRSVLAARRDSEAASTRRSRPDVPRDLDSICLKCLERQPERRYASAAELRDDLARFLRGEPTLVRPVSTAERLLRWARRSPAAAALLVLIVLTGAGLVLGLSLHSSRLGLALSGAEEARAHAESERSRAEEEAARAESERIRAEEGEVQARLLLYASDMARAVDAWRSKNHPAVLELLERQLPAEGEPDLRGFEWHFLHASCRPTADREFNHGAPVRYCAVTPDGNRLFTAGDHGRIVAWDRASGEMLAELRGHTKTVREVAVSPDGVWLASGGDDDLVLLWNLETLTLERRLGTHETGVESLAWSPDGSLLASGARYSDVRLWSPDGEHVLTIADDGRHESLLFSADGQHLYLPQKHGLAVWDLQTASKLDTHDPTSGSGPRAMCALAGGTLLACGDRFEPTICVIDAQLGALIAVVTGDCSYSNGFAAAPQGAWLASAGRDGALRLFDVSQIRTVPDLRTLVGRRRQQRLTATVMAHDGPVTSVAFADEDGLVTAGEDGVARLWQLERIWDWRRVGPEWQISDVNLSATAEIIRTPGHSPSGFLQFGANSAPVAKPVWLGGRGVHSLDEQWFARVAVNGRVEIFNIDQGRLHGVLPESIHSATAVDFTPDAEYIATIGPANQVSVSRVLDGSLAFRAELQAGRAVRFSSDGTLLAVTQRGAAFSIWDWKGRREIHRGDEGGALAWSPDGRLLVVGVDQRLDVWETRSWQFHCTFTGHAGEVLCARFSPDGQTLLSAGQGGDLRAWHIPTGQPLGILYETTLAHEVTADVAWGAGGRSIVVSTRDTGRPAFLISRSFGAGMSYAE